MPTKTLALVTGASSGIGYHLARLCAEDGHDLLVAADDADIHDAAESFRREGQRVDAVEVDLSTTEGVDELLSELEGRPVGLLFANAGRGLGRAFLDQPFREIRHVMDTNMLGTIYLLHRVVGQMREARQGRVLITGSVAGFTPGAYQAVYNASKAFLDNFSFALRHEVKEHDISVTCLMPGATETEFFDTAHLQDTKIGQSKKADPAEVARAGYDAMMRGDGDIVTGWMNKLQSAIANITPAQWLAAGHAKGAAPGSGKA
ncbi:SDR family NAD(P)-dependent oxidoreductase [Sediminicoccus sp. BL-A-41-H5]|uniref:SDR family NAD(P)-dependent oxidoreductase n=1 Tax=Sediminicoccus sp. BL-A-41-H5 TaxID=3421106 RepID=UPI003D67E4F9